MAVDFRSRMFDSRPDRSHRDNHLALGKSEGALTTMPEILLTFEDVAYVRTPVGIR